VLPRNWYPKKAALGRKKKPTGGGLEAPGKKLSRRRRRGSHHLREASKTQKKRVFHQGGGIVWGREFAAVLKDIHSRKGKYINKKRKNMESGCAKKIMLSKRVLESYRPHLGRGNRTARVTRKILPEKEIRVKALKDRIQINSASVDSLGELTLKVRRIVQQKEKRAADC